MKSITVWLLPALLTWCYEVQAKAVFAHFMVGNVALWSQARWETDIGVAQAAHIDAFALNIAFGDQSVWPSVANAFAAANAKKFKLFFSFDYAGGPGGAWPQEKVLKYLTTYINNGAYYHTEGGQPLVSTFEGPGNAADWRSIKAQTNAFFIPDYSSLGAGPAMDTGVADGLFNWNAWPEATGGMNTFVDASYYQVLGKYNVLGQPGPRGKPYMMAVSPLFYTNLPGYDKNWIWNPERLWFDRWQEVLFLQPDYVQIISWNDWGESHYIGPQDSTQWDGVFGPKTGKAPFNYVDGFAHDGFRQILPHVIDLYKKNSTMLNDESLLYWGRSVSSAACDGNGTTLNTASQLQLEYWPRIQSPYLGRYFYWGIFTDDATVTLTSESGVQVDVDWVYKPQNYSGRTVGFYFGHSDMVQPGPVTVRVSRGSNLVMQGSTTIKGGCHGPNGDNDYPDGLQNFNMWTGYASHSLSQPKLFDISSYTCVLGTSGGEFASLCYFGCTRGYCPPSACICYLIGPSSTIKPLPGKTPGPGYAKDDINYAGLCGFACGKGHCPTEYCTSVSRPVATPTISPFTPPSCTGGTGLSSRFNDLCKWTCTYGYCPIAACDCTSTGPLKKPPPVTAAGVEAKFTPTSGVMAYDNLCRWACERGHCPSVCKVPTIWDFAPNYANDPIQPYPPLTYANGTNISIENIRGTRLYGFWGCDGERATVISDAFTDMQKLAAQNGVYKNIDWDGQAATDFWGPETSDPFRVPDDTRDEIRKIFAAAEQMWDYAWFPEITPPGHWWRKLWIEVRCSDGTQGADSPDPTNACGDATPDDGNCPNGRQPPPGTDDKLQAFSDNQAATGNYDRITFCNGFFKLKDLKVAVENGEKSGKKRDLSIYDNTARCFLHEVTHLDYFMGTGPSGPADPPGKLPHVWDLRIRITENFDQIDTPVYGPKLARILRNWVDDEPNNGGYYTQRNAENYAWFALAKWVQSKIGQYPALPRVGLRKPRIQPVNDMNGLEPEDAPPNLSTTSMDGHEIGGEDDGDPPFSYPGCSDRRN